MATNIAYAVIYFFMKKVKSVSFLLSYKKECYYTLKTYFKSNTDIRMNAMI